MNFFTELKNRWNSDSPIFFQKLQAWGAWCTGVSLSLMGVAEIPGVILPEYIPQIAGYFAAAGAVMTLVAKLAVKDPNYATLDQPK